MGYQYGQDQYAIIDPAELDQVRSEADRSITIDKFVPPSEIDPIYYSGQTYSPAGRAARLEALCRAAPGDV